MNSNDAANMDFGPLHSLIGTWAGNSGQDVSPEPDGTEENLYRETLTIEPVGDAVNAEQQKLMTLRYQQIVHRIRDNKLIHHELGYWIWDAETQTVMNSLIIPRAVCVLARGEATASAEIPLEISVCARHDDPNFGITQQPFMQDNARTIEFRRTMTVDGDKLTYAQTTVVEIYGKTFDHTDQNELTRTPE